MSKTELDRDLLQPPAEAFAALREFLFDNGHPEAAAEMVEWIRETCEFGLDADTPRVTIRGLFHHGMRGFPPLIRRDNEYEERRRKITAAPYVRLLMAVKGQFKNWEGQ